MGAFIELGGQRFGRLIVLRRGSTNNHKQTTWECQCDCGNVVNVRGYHLRQGAVNSCGCLAKEASARRFKTHGLAESRLYRIWGNIKDRCYRENSPSFARYGGRGIGMCDEWRGSFEAFQSWAMGAGYTDDLSIDRDDNDGNYEPDNCHWVPWAQQARNRANNTMIEFNGVTRCLAAWAEVLGTSQDLLSARLTQGWSIERAFTTPTRITRRTKSPAPIVTPQSL